MHSSKRFERATNSTVTEAKQEMVRSHATNMLKEIAGGRVWVSRLSLRSFDGVANSPCLALPLTLFYKSSLHGVINDWSKANKPAALGRRRIRLAGGNGHMAKQDLREWTRLGRGGRVFAEPEPQCTIDTDAAELGWGGTGEHGEGPGRKGIREEANMDQKGA